MAEKDPDGCVATEESHQRGGWDQGLQPSNHCCQLEKRDSELQAVDVLDIAGMFFGEIRDPDDGEPEYQVLTVGTTAKAASVTGSCEGFKVFDEVTNGDCPRVIRNGQVSMQV